MMQLIEMYSKKQRTGVLDLESGIEAYIIPHCHLVDRLLRTARNSAVQAMQDATSIPDTLQEAQLLLVVIHRKVNLIIAVCMVCLTVVSHLDTASAFPSVPTISVATVQYKIGQAAVIIFLLTC